MTEVQIVLLLLSMPGNIADHHTPQSSRISSYAMKLTDSNLIVGNTARDCLRHQLMELCNDTDTGCEAIAIPHN